MTPTLLSHLAAAVLVGGAMAQTVTSPAGFSSLEGDASHFALFNAGYQRFMQIDNSLVGTARPGLKSIAFRRDGFRRSATGGSRAVDITVRIGHGDFGTVDGTFATNWKGTPVTAFAKRRLNTPDWSQLAGAPAPFDFTIPFDAPWSYNGSDALVWEVVCENITAIGGPDVDRHLGTTNAFTSDFGRSVGFGCLVSPTGFEMNLATSVRNYGPNHAQFGLQLDAGVVFGPANQAAILNIDTTDANLNVPGLCSTLHALPLLAVGLGTADADGTVSPVTLNLPFDAALENLPLWTQAVALRPGGAGLPIAVSNARITTFPTRPIPPPPAAYLYATSVAATSATLWRDRAVIAQLMQ